MVGMQDPIATSNTKEQLLVHSWCQELGLTALLEWETPPYYIDIYLPELKLGIELDGATHSRRRDAKRDAFIKRRHKIDIWRIKNKEVVESYKEKLFERIIERAEDGHS